MGTLTVRLTAGRLVGCAALLSLAIGLSAPAVADDEPVDDFAKGEKTDIVEDSVAEKTLPDGTKVYEQTIKVKNKSADEVTVHITSHPWKRGDKFKEDEDGQAIRLPDGTYAPKPGEAGKYGDRQEKKDVEIAAGETATVTFTWTELWPIRYSDVYIDKVRDSATNSRFDVSNLSPTQPQLVPEGAVGVFPTGLMFPFPFAVGRDAGDGPLPFVLAVDLIDLPDGWSIDFGFPEPGTLFLLDFASHVAELDIDLLLSLPAVRGDFGQLIFHLTQPDLGYDYFIQSVFGVAIDEPATLALLLASAGLLWHRRRRG